MKALFLLLIPFVFLKCGGDMDSNFKLDVVVKKNKLQWGDTIRLKIKNKKNIPIKTVNYRLNGEAVEEVFVLKEEPLGKHNIDAVVSYDDQQLRLQKPITIVADTPPQLYTYSIVNEYPHDEKAYTQGLEFDDDILLESTGLRGQSSLRKVNFKTGEIIENKPLDDSYFGEGLTIINEMIYQLTWQSKLGFIYNKEDLQLIRSFPFEKSQEGWGLCNDGNVLYKSDGTNTIWLLDANSQKEIGNIQVMTNKRALNKLNELEWVDGKIYANTYQFEKEVAVIIDPKSGKVEGVIDFTGLKDKVNQHSELNVLNGIAYHPKRKTFFVTGKNWSTLFEVKIEENNGQ